jgi:hypothetical protein
MCMAVSGAAAVDKRKTGAWDLFAGEGRQAARAGATSVASVAGQRGFHAGRPALMPRKPPKFRRKSTDGSPAPDGEEKVMTGTAAKKRRELEEAEDAAGDMQFPQVILQRFSPKRPSAMLCIWFCRRWPNYRPCTKNYFASPGSPDLRAIALHSWAV